MGQTVAIPVAMISLNEGARAQKLGAGAAVAMGRPSAEAVRAAVEANPGASARPFATPAGWKPVVGALVRLRPGLGEKKGLRAGELATVTEVNNNGIMLKRN